MYSRFVGFAAAVLSFGVASVASAQGRAAKHLPIELGTDASVTVDLSTPHTTTVDIPAQYIRAGFFISRQVSLEPVVGLTSVSSSGDHLTAYSANLGVLWHLQKTRVGTGLYLRPFVGFTGYSVSGGGSTTQAVLGGGVGVKLPVARRVATRFEVAYGHSFASGSSESTNSIGVLAGLSVFLR